MKKLGVALVATTLLLLSAAPAMGQATRTWVSQTAAGDDVNPCSRTAPCRTWAGAISKTAAGGEINATDSGGYGALTITKGITIDGTGVHASTLNSAVNGFIIDIDPATQTKRDVILRNITINGAGTTLGTRGVFVRASGAETLTLENVRIYNQSDAGVRIVPGGPKTSDPAQATEPGTLDVVLDRVHVSNVGGHGVEIAPADGVHPVNVFVRDSIFETSAGGLRAAGNAHAWLTGNTFFSNAVAITRESGAVVDSYCDNHFADNASDGDKPTELCPQPVPVQTPQPVVVTQQVEAPERCRVPDLKGLTRAAATRVLEAGNCSLGTVKRKKVSKRKQVGKVLSQTVRVGDRLDKGAKVGVTLGRRR
jgi:hypothetical protein